MFEPIINNIPAHICALIGLIFLIISTQVKEKNKILINQTLFSFFFFLQYILLGILSASMLSLVSIIRNLLYYKTSNKNYNIIILLTIIVGIITTILDMKNYAFIISVTPLIINLLYTISLSKNNIKFIKKTFFICSIIWIIYNYLVKAYIGVIVNLLEAISYIYLFLNKKKEDL